MSALDHHTGVLTYTKYFLDVNRALEHWRYSFKLTTLRTCNNFMFFLLFFMAVSDEVWWKSVTSMRI